MPVDEGHVQVEEGLVDRERGHAPAEVAAPQDREAQQITASFANSVNQVRPPVPPSPPGAPNTPCIEELAPFRVPCVEPLERSVNRSHDDRTPLGARRDPATPPAPVAYAYHPPRYTRRKQA